MRNHNKYLKSVFLIIFFLLLIQSFLFAQIIHVDKVINIGPPINTANADFAPSFTSDGKVLVFNSKRGSRYQDIYISYLENGLWTNPRPIYSINSAYNDESPYITPDGAYIIFSSDRDGSYEIPADTSGKVRVSFDIYISKNIGGKWDRPIKLPGQVNTVHHERTPSLSHDSKTIYYTSMPFGDIGRARIMKADYSNGEFKYPVALPSPVNNNAQDTGLVPSLDGKGFYFSSRRPGGFGGWDIYFIKYENSRFGKPVNLGSKINSEGNEINLTLIDDSIFFCSNRTGGYGSYDVYTSRISVEDDTLRIIVRDKKTKKPLQVEMELSTIVKEKDNKETEYRITKKTNEKGEATVKHKPQVKDLDVKINEDDYLPLFESIDIPALKGRTKVLELVPLEKEASFDIHSIHFDFESSKIKPESYPYLDSLADYLKKHPTMKFEIIGHTDLHGTHEFNDKLSLNRAKSVKDYLVSKGLDEKRFTIKGKGKRRPLVPQTGPESDEKNRRTEFKLIEK